MLGMDDHQREIAHPQGAQTLADEIQVTRGVDEIEELAAPIGVHERGRDRDLPLLFTDMIIRDRGAFGDPSHAGDDPRAAKHGLAQQCFPGRGMTDEGKIADISGIFHKPGSHSVNALQAELMTGVISNPIGEPWQA